MQGQWRTFIRDNEWKGCREWGIENLGTGEVEIGAWMAYEYLDSVDMNDPPADLLKWIGRAGMATVFEAATRNRRLA